MMFFEEPKKRFMYRCDSLASVILCKAMSMCCLFWYFSALCQEAQRLEESHTDHFIFNLVNGYYE